MDKNNMPVGDSQWRNNSVASSSKMDTVEENRWRTDAVVSSSMTNRSMLPPVGEPLRRNYSVGSVRPINTVSIDTRYPGDEVEAPRLEHFSIREFVAGISKRDPNKCSPFQCDDNADVERNAVEMQLVSTSNANAENDAQRGHEHSSREWIPSDPSNTLVVYDPYCEEDHEAMRYSRDKTSVHANEGVTAPGNASLRSDNANRAVNAATRRRSKLRFLADIMEEEKASTSLNTQVIERCAELESELQSAAKRLKAIVQEKTSVTNEIFDSYSEGDASMMLDLNETTKANQPPSFLSVQRMDEASSSNGKRPLVEPDHSPPSNISLEDLDLQVALALSLNSYIGMEGNSNKRESSRQHTDIPNLNESDPAEERSPTMQRNMTSASCSRVAIREGKRKVGESEPQAIKYPDNVQTRGFSAVNMSRWPEPIHLPVTNTMSTDIGSSNVAINQSSVSSFPQVNSGWLDVRSSEVNQFKLFGSFPLRQKKNPQDPASSFALSRPQPGEGASEDLVWLPRREAVSPLHPNYPIPPNVRILDSFQYHWLKGTAMDDATSSDKITGSKPVSSLDGYSNKIPAMQLLNLMHRGNAPSSSFMGQQNSFLNSQLPSYNHHIQVNENQTSRAKAFAKFPIGFSFPRTRKTYIRNKVHRGQAIRLNPSTSIAVAQPLRDNSSLGLCSLNQNPAELNLADASKEYTISWRDLNPQKRNVSKEGSSSGNANGQKKQQTRKDPPGK